MADVVIDLEVKMSAVTAAKNFMVVRRMEFYIVELTIFSMPVLVAAHSFRDVFNPVVLEGLILFFVIYALGDMINCLVDRDLDATYKTRLSSAVYGIGVSNVRNLVIAEAVISLVLAVHLSLVTGRWLILGLVLVGMFLGIQYSIGPFFFKSRGILHLVCLWLLLYFLPMLCASLFVQDTITWQILALAATYATVEMGIILINTSEDLPEDRAMGVRTTTVALGLKRTIVLATSMVLLGGLGFILFYLSLYRSIPTPAWGYLVVAGLALGWLFVLRGIWTLMRGVAGAKDEQSAVGLVKAKGMMVPVWATMVGWLGVLCAIIGLVLR
jgi:1,4-dihydroxy-2-naphthoate octaprenyltransferase